MSLHRKASSESISSDPDTLLRATELNTSKSF
jgi:hypothetical protein